MQYVITFLEGIISFISPCMLPMLPIYISYFAGGGNNKQKTFQRALAFVIGFTLVFSLLGLFAGTVGSFLSRYQKIVNIICGLIGIVFGLSFLEVIRLPFFKGIKGGHTVNSIFSAFIFGIVFSVSLTPCVGAFLGSAIMLASASGTATKGILLLFAYSLGMGIPFLLSAVLIEKLQTVFNSIKKHYRIINLICGLFLILTGILMMFDMLNSLLAIMR